jgi:hypothetical protein
MEGSNLSTRTTNRLTASTEYQKFDNKDVTWWPHREMGTPDDPYNKIPKLQPSDPLYDEYMEQAEKNFDTMLKDFESDNWDFYQDENGVRVDVRDSPDNPIRSFRGAAIINATAEVIRLHLVQIDLRPYWDAAFQGGHYHMEVCENVRLVYYSFKAPWPVTNRDFIVCAGEKITDNGIVISAVSSIVRDDVPERDGYVRGVLGPSGFVIKPLDNDEEGKPRCMVTYMASVNPMGWIPTMVVNAVGIEQPMCIINIKNAIALTQIMVEECFMKLFELPEDQWEAKNIKRIIYRAIDNNNGKRDMLVDPLSYAITGTRKPERPVEEVMQELGKKGSMRKLWDGALPYLKSTANKELFAAAHACLSS